MSGSRREFVKTAVMGMGSVALGGLGCAGRGQRGDAAAPSDVAQAGTDLEAPGTVEAGAEAGVRKRPNVLFILADQWRGQATGFAGDVNARTPNLDVLAGQSVTFSHAVSCTPVCCPYRASLMTGRYPTSTGVFLNDVYLTPDPGALAQTFARAGYDTGYIGKWHLDGHGSRSAYIPPDRHQGFQRWMALECTHDYNHSAYYTDDPTKQFWDGYDAIAQTSALQSWLTQRDTSKPFFFMLSWGPPHDPYDTAPTEARRPAPESMVLRPNVPAGLGDAVRANLSGYYAHIAALDRCVGDLMKTLDDLGLSDDTIVVFTSDHGDMHGSQGQFAKEHPWDESILVPFLLRYPAGLGRRQQTVAMPIDTPDIMPTLLGLAGLTVPATVQGTDLSPVLRSEKAAEDAAALIMCVSPFGVWSRDAGGKEYRGLRSGRYTYVRDLAGPWLLYDNQADPYQLNNLVGQSAYAEIAGELDARLSAKLAGIDDPFLPGDWYIKKWGYTVDASGTVPYTG
jgi:arylsulfatase A-like enzyme